MIPPSTEGFEEKDFMFNDLLDIEELCTADSVGEANRLLQDGWELLGFHPAPAAPAAAFGSPTTIFVMARMYDFDEEDDDVDLEIEDLQALEPLNS